MALLQFAGTSLWFAINAVMPDLQRNAALPPESTGWLTAAVQIGFIVGTLCLRPLLKASAARCRRRCEALQEARQGCLAGSYANRLHPAK